MCDHQFRAYLLRLTNIYTWMYYTKATYIAEIYTFSRKYEKEKKKKSARPVCSPRVTNVSRISPEHTEIIKNQSFSMIQGGHFCLMRGGLFLFFLYSANDVHMSYTSSSCYYRFIYLFAVCLWWAKRALSIKSDRSWSYIFRIYSAERKKNGNRFKIRVQSLNQCILLVCSPF